MLAASSVRTGLSDCNHTSSASRCAIPWTWAAARGWSTVYRCNHLPVFLPARDEVGLCATTVLAACHKACLDAQPSCLVIRKIRCCTLQGPGNAPSHIGAACGELLQALCLGWGCPCKARARP